MVLERIVLHRLIVSLRSLPPIGLTYLVQVLCRFREARSVKLGNWDRMGRWARGQHICKPDSDADRAFREARFVEEAFDAMSTELASVGLMFDTRHP